MISPMKNPAQSLLISLAAVLLIPAVVLLWTMTTESGLRWAYQQAHSYIPGTLQIDKLEGRLAGPLTLHGLKFDQQGVAITAKQLIINWSPGALLSGRIDINQLHVHSLNIELTESDQTRQNGTIALPEVQLPWLIALNDMLIDGFSIQQRGETITLDQIRFDASALLNSIDIEQLSIKDDSFEFHLQGKLIPPHDYRHELELSWHYLLPSRQKLTGSGSIVGDVINSKIRQQIEGPLVLSLNAQLNNLLTQFRWQTRIKAESENIALLDSRFPTVKGSTQIDASGDLSNAHLSGSLNGDSTDTGPFDANFRLNRSAENSIDIEKLQLSVPTSNTHINAQGQWQPGANGGNADLALQWQNLRWPITGDAWFDSAIGSGWIKGSPEHYQFDLSSDRPWPQVPASQWHASAEGNLDGLNVSSLRIETLEGQALARGRLGWSPNLHWDAVIDLTDINPVELQADWPGKLHGTLLSKGGYENDQWSVSADVHQLIGELRGYPVSLQSRLDWHNNNLDIQQFELNSGNSKVILHGQMGQTLNLNWNINSPDLKQLYPRTEGQLNTEGIVSGTRETPHLRTSLKGSSLRLFGYEAENLEGKVDADLMRWQQLDIQLSAQSLRFKDYTVKSLQITADSQRIETKASLPEMDLQLALQGKADEHGWQGEIQKAMIENSQFGDWQLSAAAPLTLTTSGIKLDSLCWQQQTAQLCSTLAWDKNSGPSKLNQAKLNFDNLPLSLLSPWLPPDLDLKGVADGKAEFAFSGTEKITGHANISLPSGAVSYPLLEGERDHWQYRSGKLKLNLNDTGLQAVTAFETDNGDRFQARLNLPGANLLTLDPAQQPLQGEAQFKVNDLGLLEAVLDEAQDLHGEIEVKLNLNGTLNQPRINGHADLKNGSFRIPRLGLNIEQIIAKAQSDGDEKLSFQVNAQSGEGTLALQGQASLDRSAGWPTDISIKGNAFEVSRIPEARLNISPDLTVQIQNHSITTKGEVHIPYARMQPKGTTATARVSEDTVIISGEQVTEEKWKIFTRVRLSLGERVNFYGFGFEGRFGGNLLLEDEPGQLTKATGELNVPEGRYSAYGQRLDVEQGRLLYAGGPLINPGLDFRSVRRIGNITAGLKVRGTLNQPQIELFSIPAMGQTDALAYLLLGRPIENASGEEGAMMAKATLALGLIGGDKIARTLGQRFGFDEMRVATSDTDDQASLVIGRYLSPKLYISYGVGLIEAVNTFNVRYQINDKWQLKGESGEHQGADLFYTIESGD